MPVTNLTVGGGRNLKVYVADTPRQWQRGLIGFNLNDADGMLFRFSADVHLPFHMVGMHVPILIAFYTVDGVLVESPHQLWPGDAPYRPAASYRYALELVGDHTDEIPSTTLWDSLVVSAA